MRGGHPLTSHVPAPVSPAQSTNHAQAIAAPVSPAELQVPANLHGFQLLREEYVAEYDAKVFLFKHEKTGAEVTLTRKP